MELLGYVGEEEAKLLAYVILYRNGSRSLSAAGLKALPAERGGRRGFSRNHRDESLDELPFL